MTDWGIACRVESLFELADTIEARLATARRQGDTFTLSLPPPHGFAATSLDRAFRGELVPQEPNDEPASVLLERIGTKGTVHAKAWSWDWPVAFLSASLRQLRQLAK